MQLLVLGLVALLFYVVWPVVGAVTLGGFVALVAWRPWQWLQTRFGRHRTLAGLVATLVVMLLVLVPFVLTVYLLAKQVLLAVGWLEAQLQAGGGLQALIARLPSTVQRLARRYEGTAVSTVSRVASWVPALLGEIGRFTAEGFLAAVTAFYCFTAGPRIVAFLRQVSPVSSEHSNALLDEFSLVAKGLFWGNVVTALLHGVFGAIGYWIAGLGSVLLLGALTVFASFIPGIGTAVIWMPLAIALWLVGHHVGAVFLLIWGVVVIGGIDQVLRPILARGGTRLPTLLMFLTIYGGLMVFGLKGLLLGPLFGALAMAALRIVARQRHGELVVVTPIGARTPVVHRRPLARIKRRLLAVGDELARAWRAGRRRLRRGARARSSPPPTTS